MMRNWQQRRHENQPSSAIRATAPAASVEPLEKRQLLAAITVVVTDPRFAPSGGSPAVPDDGVNDAPAIQRAIDYTPTPGNVLKQPDGSSYTVQSGDTVGTVYFPAGVYDFLTPPPGGPQGPNLRLRPGIDASRPRTYLGAPGAILRRPFGPGTLLDHNAPILQGTGPDAHDIIVKGLIFEGAGLKLEQSNSGVWVDNVDVINCTFRNVSAGDGLSFMLGITSGARNCDFTDNVFQNLNCFAGIFALNVESFRILRNSFDQVQIGIQLGGPTRAAAPGGEIADNRITGVLRQGVEIIPGGADDRYYNGLYVRRNIVSDFRTRPDGSYDPGCFALEIITNLGTNVVIEGNKVFGRLLADPAYGRLPVYGIEVSGDNVLVKDNLVEGFWVPIAANAYHLPQSEAVMRIEGNRLRGEWWSGVPDGVERRTTATWNLSGHNATRAVERAVIVGGDLIVTNNAFGSTDDTILVSGSDMAANVTVNGTAASGSPFAFGGGIFVYGRDGHDNVTIATSLTRRASLIGGNGNDTLVAGSGPATIYGDAGSDSLAGGSANDSVFGVSGDDRVDGGAGSDVLSGGLGVDELVYERHSSAVMLNLASATNGISGTEDSTPFADFENLAGGAGNDTLIGNSGDNMLSGAGGDDTITVNSGTDTVDGGAGLDTLNVNTDNAGNAAAILNITQDLATLNIGNGGNAVLGAGADKAIRVNTLNIAGGGRLDLNDNAMIVSSGNLAGITALLRSGLSNGGRFDWLGNGIASSRAGSLNAAAGSALFALGVIRNDLSQVGGSGPVYTSFAGIGGLSVNDVLVRFTYSGDADLSGAVDATDYSLIDGGFVNRRSGWIHGDFDHSGGIDATDHSLIDNAWRRTRP
ncbi:calcium-binding protein [Fontivita pretiosa]|uniref:calcium-binding protein n=1 Tax=Fontivita pretiosa TaxID=2989684 RepID=UPI003D177F19